MSTSPISALTLLAASLFILGGCTTHSHQNLTLDQRIERGKRAAISAVESPETWERVRGQRLTHEPYKIDPARVGHRFYETQMDTASYRQGEALVIFTVPTGVRFGLHSTFVDVTVRRDTSDVVGMREYYYP